MCGMLVAKYGGTRADAKARVDGVVERARTVGLVYDMEKALIGSSFDAHRLLQLAKTKGLGDAAKERLLKAYFTEGAHIADTATLVRLATALREENCEMAVGSGGAHSQAIPAFGLMDDLAFVANSAEEMRRTLRNVATWAGR